MIFQSASAEAFDPSIMTLDFLSFNLDYAVFYSILRCVRCRVEQTQNEEDAPHFIKAHPQNSD